MKKQSKKETKQPQLSEKDLAKVVGGAGGGLGSPVHPSGPGG